MREQEIGGGSVPQVAGGTLIGEDGLIEWLERNEWNDHRDKTPEEHPGPPNHGHSTTNLNAHHSQCNKDTPAQLQTHPDEAYCTIPLPQPSFRPTQMRRTVPSPSPSPASDPPRRALLYHPPPLHLEDPHPGRQS
ncbi:unnamed protein product [Coregonus sp. 'balchen']|nr:unnamed protein product [Coregonus sp. 'balchen']